MAQINEDLTQAEENLKGMGACCGICVLPCNKSSEIKEDAGLWKGKDDGTVVNSQPQRVGVDMSGVPPCGEYMYTNNAREDEMEQNMKEVADMASNMKKMAMDMGSEVEWRSFCYFNTCSYQNERNDNACKILKTSETSEKLLIAN